MCKVQGALRGKLKAPKLVPALNDSSSPFDLPSDAHGSIPDDWRVIQVTHLLLLFASPDVVKDPWIHFKIGIFSHPAIQMAVALYDTPLIPTLGEPLSEHIQALLRRAGLPDRVVSTAQKTHPQSLESLYVIRSNQIHKFGQAISDMVRRSDAHLREMGKETHMNTAEEFVKPIMCRAIEVDMAPAAAKGNIAAMTHCRTTQLFSATRWVEAQQLIENTLNEGRG